MGSLFFSFSLPRPFFCLFLSFSPSHPYCASVMPVSARMGRAAKARLDLVCVKLRMSKMRGGGGGITPQKGEDGGREKGEGCVPAASPPFPSLLSSLTCPDN